jgi:hypothetical protein
MPINSLFYVGLGSSFFRCAIVAELVDALDLGSSGVTRESSSLSFRTIILLGWWLSYTSIGRDGF